MRSGRQRLDLDEENGRGDEEGNAKKEEEDGRNGKNEKDKMGRGRGRWLEGIGRLQRGLNQSIDKYMMDRSFDKYI